MRTKTLLIGCALLAAVVGIAGPAAANCDNYGVIVNTGTYTCTVNYCFAGAVGVGAGYGGQGHGATAGTNCGNRGSVLPLPDHPVPP